MVMTHKESTATYRDLYPTDIDDEIIEARPTQLCKSLQAAYTALEWYAEQETISGRGVFVAREAIVNIRKELAE